MKNNAKITLVLLGGGVAVVASGFSIWYRTPSPYPVMIDSAEVKCTPQRHLHLAGRLRGGDVHHITNILVEESEKSRISLTFLARPVLPGETLDFRFQRDVPLPATWPIPEKIHINNGPHPDFEKILTKVSCP
jgi:hypothetical protein